LGNKENQEYVDELFEIIRHLREKGDYKNQVGEIIELKRTSAYDILRIFLKGNWTEGVDEDSYLFEVYEIAREFEQFMNESYCIVSDDKNLIFNIVTINLEKRFEEYLKKNKTIVLMSGTIHAKEVLKDVFGIKNFKIIEAETKNQGEVKIKRTGLEKDCKYSNFSNGNHSREDYLLALEKSLEIASRPTLVHVNAYLDLPSEREKSELGLSLLVSREELRESQFEDKIGENVKRFKEGRKDILFSTRDSRGVDFPGDQCRSIIFTKYPNPNVRDPFWKILMRTNPGHYWEFYKDKAKRELVQKVYRGVRSSEDYVELLSPDIRVLETAKKEFEK
jgi:Rad3-related DNA helicase